MIDLSRSPVVILACNTLSSLIFHYNLKFQKTVVDVITPTIYFLRKKKYKHICILSTKNTKEMDVYSKLLTETIEYIDASDLILEIENNQINQFTIMNILDKINDKTDVLLLGCTHLIKVKEEIRDLVNIDVLSQDEIFIDFLNEKI